MHSKLVSFLLMALMAFYLGSGTAYAACTPEELDYKARQIATKLERLRNSNEDEYQRILLRFNNKARLLDPNDIDAMCDLYDQMLFEI